MMLNFNSYEDLKNKLQIRIYDPDFSRNLLEGKVVTYIGDFALVYMATLYESEKKLGNLMLTPELMDALGIDIQTLHKDAMLSDLNYEPVLFTTEDLIEALRVYKTDEILVHRPDADRILHIMDQIIHLDKILAEYDEEEA